MSELLGSQESKPVSDYHPSPQYNLCDPVSDCHPSPQYHLYEPSLDMLTSVIENEHARRLAIKQCTKLEIESENLAENHPVCDDGVTVMIEYLEKSSLLLKEEMEMIENLSNVLKERLENPEIYLAMGRLSDSEFDRAYASLKQNPNRQIQRGLAQSSQDCDKSFGASRRKSLKVDHMDDKFSQSPPSYDMAASVRKAGASATVKPPRSFWKKFWKY